jgi:DNA-binding NarL/FixJ family response regulator
MIKVAVVDNDEFVCESLQARLSREDDFECVGAVGTATGASKLVRETQPDLIVLDLMLADVPDPIDLAASLVGLSPRSQVIVCTAWSDNWRFDRQAEFRMKVRASRKGITDWVNKGEGVNELVKRLRDACRRRPAQDRPLSALEEQLYNSLQQSELVFNEQGLHSRNTGLTPAENRAASIVAHGLEADMTVEEICRLRNLNLGNVRAQLRNIYSKWDVHGQAAFVAEARRRGLLDAR